MYIYKVETKKWFKKYEAYGRTEKETVIALENKIKGGFGFNSKLLITTINANDRTSDQPIVSKRSVYWENYDY